MRRAAQKTAPLAHPEPVEPTPEFQDLDTQGIVLFKEPPPGVGNPEPGETGLGPDLGETVITAGPVSPPWWLRSGFGDEVQLLGDSAILGRFPDAEVSGDAQIVAITDATRTTSKTHARLDFDGDAWTITDLASSNGTAIGDTHDATPIVAYVPTPLVGDVFWLGDVEFSVTRDAPTLSPTLMSPPPVSRDATSLGDTHDLGVVTRDTTLDDASSRDATFSVATPHVASTRGAPLGDIASSSWMSREATSGVASSARDTGDMGDMSRDATPDATGKSAASGSRRRRAIVLLSVAGAAITLTCGALVAVSLLSPGQATADNSDTQSGSVATVKAVPGWTGDATWSVPGTAVPMTESPDAAYVGYIASGAAVVLDAATGDLIAKVPLGEGAEPELYRIGDMLAGYDDAAIYLWAPGDASWTSIERDPDQVVSIRGDSMFVVLEQGRSFGYPDADAGLKTVLSPTKGAVPIGHTGDKVHWGTNAKKLFVTTTSGAAVSDAEMRAPVPDAALKKWVATTSSYAYLLWEKGDETFLASHDISTGEVVSFDPAPKADPEASWLSTRNGALALFGGKQIDTTTGAITSLPEGFSSRAIIGDQVYGGSDGEDAFLDLVTSEVRHVPHLEVVPLAGGPKGGLIAASSGEIYSFPMDAGTTGQKQQSSKETDS